MKIKLSTGKEIELTAEELKELKPIIDKEFSILPENFYNKVKASSREEIQFSLEYMSDDELLEFAKENDKHRPEGYNNDAFSQKIYRELFLRKGGLGYSQLRRLSKIQKTYIKSLGLRII